MSLDIYVKRRARLAKKLGTGAVAIIPSGRMVQRNGDVHYPFRPDSDFFYLTGFSEPNALIVLTGGKATCSVLFCAPKDPEKELWEGERIGPRKAKRNFAFTAAYPATYDEDMWQRIRVFTNPAVKKGLLSFAAGAQSLLPEVVDPSAKSATDLAACIGEMRLIKSANEIATMQKAASISARAHKAILFIAKPHMREYELEAELAYRFRIAGGDPLHAYPPIVASGKNACTLHYTKNDALLRSGDLVLIDAGCEYEGYASDITRTFPANGKFTKAQRTLYDMVLRAQLAAIKKVKPGVPLHEVHTAAALVIAAGLLELGWVYADDAWEVIARNLHRPYFPHGTSHWLGSDVHDSGNYERSEDTRKAMRVLEPGMVITVEPGLYVRPQKGIPRAFWNIGIRIEDDVLVTKDGNTVLSKEAPKDPDEIENIMAAK